MACTLCGGPHRRHRIQFETDGNKVIAPGELCSALGVWLVQAKTVYLDGNGILTVRESEAEILPDLPGASHQQMCESLYDEDPDLL